MSRSLVVPASLALSAALMSLMGCSGAGDPATAPQPASPAALLGGAQSTAPDLVESLAGTYRAEVDLATLQARATLSVSRASQQNDDVYELSIDNFTTPETFVFRAVRMTPETVELDYTITHPFPKAEDLSAPPNGFSNRADLGVSGRTLFFFEGAEAYFGGTVSANTQVVANADGYVQPGELVRPRSLDTDCFPHKLFIDELATDGASVTGNRLGVSNGGLERGNYDAGIGWQSPTFDAGWTGYGVLHQGQSAINTVAIDRDAITTSSFVFDIGLLVKYNDPRGNIVAGERAREHRLPQNDDPLWFSYRMPHGAIDVQQVTVVGTTGDLIAEDPLATANVFVDVTDWDARATEAPTNDLSGEPDVSLVAAGEAGVPLVEMSLPGLLVGSSNVLLVGDNDGDLGLGVVGDPEPDSGLPGDPLWYSAVIANETAAPGQTPGEYRGMIRATDVTISEPDWRFGLDPDLALLPGVNGELATFQAFTVEVDEVIIPTCTPTTAGWVKTNMGSSLDRAAHVAVDGDGNAYVVGEYLSNPANFGGPNRPSTDGNWDAFLVKYDKDGNYAYDVRIGGANYEWSHRVATNGEIVVWGGVFQGSIDIFGTPYSTTGPDEAWFVVLDADTGAHLWHKVWGDLGGDVCNGAAIDTNGDVLVGGYFSGSVNFGGTTYNTGATNQPSAVLIRYDNAGTWIWDRVWGGFSTDRTSDLNLDPSGNAYLTGYFFGNVDFGTGPQSDPSGNGGYIVSWSNTSALRWFQLFDGPLDQLGRAVAVDENGNAYGCGYNTGAVDTGGGPNAMISTKDVFLAKYDTNGNWQWDVTYGVQVPLGGLRNMDCAADLNGVVMVGESEVGANFGGGTRTNRGADDGFMVKLEPDGTYDWDVILGGTGDDSAYGVALGCESEIRVSGYYSGTVSFNPAGGGTLGPAGNWDIFTAAFHADGTW